MKKLLEQLNRQAQQIVNLVQDVPEATLRRKPAVGWAALEVLGHLRDREHVFGERITLFEKAEPFIHNWDEEAAAGSGRYLAEAPQRILDEFQALRQRNIHRLAAVAATVWDQVAQHEVQGRYSLRDEVERMVAHDEAHLQQLTTLLALS